MPRFGGKAMKKTALFVVFFFTLASFMPLNAQWAKTYGGSQYDSVADLIQLTDTGGYIVCGRTASFGAGSYDIWLLELSALGEVEWERTYGGSGGDYPYSIQQTSDGGYILAGTTYSFGSGDGDAWVLKVSSTGDVEWEKTYGGIDYDTVRCLQTTSDGGYIVVGYTENWGAGGYDIWILRLSSTGSIVWQNTYGGFDNDYGWSIEQTSDGGYIVGGETFSFGDFSDNAWVLKLSSTGSIVWQKIYGGSDMDWSSEAHQTGDGGYIVVGGTFSFGAGDCDGWILKLNSAGTVQWQRAYGEFDFDYTYSIQQTSDDGYIVGGYTYSFGAGTDDAWVIKLDSNGDIDWERTYGDTLSDWGRGIQETGSGGYIGYGSTYSTGAGSSDFSILKLYSDGDIDPSCGFEDSFSSEINTSVSAVNTNVSPDDTIISPLSSSCTVQYPTASVSLICEAPMYTLTISATTGGTTNPAPGMHDYYNNTGVQISAIPSFGYEFLNWSGNVPLGSESNNPITINIDSNKSITANFSKTDTDDDGDGDDDGGGGGGGGCFVATAAYGSPLHPFVNVLREFRDKYLMPSSLGRKFVNLYYKYSPFASNFIAKYKPLKIMVRVHLLPVIVFCYSMVQLGSIMTALIFSSIFVLPIFLISFFRMNFRRTKA